MRLIREYIPVIKDVVEEVTVIKGEITTIEGEVSDVQKEISKIDDKISTMHLEIVTIENDISAVETDIVSIETDVGNIQTALTTLEQNVDKIEGDVTELKTEYDALNAEINDFISVVNASVVLLTAENETLADLKNRYAAISTDEIKISEQLTTMGALQWAPSTGYTEMISTLQNQNESRQVNCFEMRVVIDYGLLNDWISKAGLNPSGQGVVNIGSYSSLSGLEVFNRMPKGIPCLTSEPVITIMYDTGKQKLHFKTKNKTLSSIDMDGKGCSFVTVGVMLARSAVNPGNIHEDMLCNNTLDLETVTNALVYGWTSSIGLDYSTIVETNMMHYTLQVTDEDMSVKKLRLLAAPTIIAGLTVGYHVGFSNMDVTLGTSGGPITTMKGNGVADILASIYDADVANGIICVRTDDIATQLIGVENDQAELKKIDAELKKVTPLETLISQVLINTQTLAEVTIEQTETPLAENVSKTVECSGTLFSGDINAQWYENRANGYTNGFVKGESNDGASIVIDEHFIVSVPPSTIIERIIDVNDNWFIYMTYVVVPAHTSFAFGDDNRFYLYDWYSGGQSDVTYPLYEKGTPGQDWILPYHQRTEKSQNSVSVDGIPAINVKQLVLCRNGIREVPSVVTPTTGVLHFDFAGITDDAYVDINVTLNTPMQVTQRNGTVSYGYGMNTDVASSYSNTPASLQAYPPSQRVSLRSKSEIAGGFQIDSTLGVEYNDAKEVIKLSGTLVFKVTSFDEHVWWYAGPGDPFLSGNFSGTGTITIKLNNDGSVSVPVPPVPVGVIGSYSETETDMEGVLLTLTSKIEGIEEQVAELGEYVYQLKMEVQALEQAQVLQMFIDLATFTLGELGFSEIIGEAFKQMAGFVAKYGSKLMRKLFSISFNQLSKAAKDAVIAVLMKLVSRSDNWTLNMTPYVGEAIFEDARGISYATAAQAIDRDKIWSSLPISTLINPVDKSLMYDNALKLGLTAWLPPLDGIVDDILPRIDYHSIPLVVLPSGSATFFEQQARKYIKNATDLREFDRRVSRVRNVYHSFGTYHDIDAIVTDAGKATIVEKMTIFGVSEPTCIVRRNMLDQSKIVGSVSIGKIPLGINNGKRTYRIATYTELGYTAKEVENYAESLGINFSEVSTDQKWEWINVLINNRLGNATRVASTTAGIDSYRFRILEKCLFNKRAFKYNLITSNCQSLVNGVKEFVQSGSLQGLMGSVDPNLLAEIVYEVDEELRALIRATP